MKQLLAFALFVGMWAYTGYCNYHYALGEFTAQAPGQNHVKFARGWAITGPFGFIINLVYGERLWLDKPYTCQQRWSEFHKSSPSIDRDWFVHWAGNYTCRVEELK